MRCPSCPKRSRESRVGSHESDLSEPAAVAAGLLLTAAETTGAVDEIERLVSARNSGFGFPDDLTQLEKELVLVWDDNVAAFERAHKVRTMVLFEALLQRRT